MDSASISTANRLKRNILKYRYWIGLSIVLVVFVLRVANHFWYTPDDTYIYLQYARNAIQYHEMSFNAGEPSYGFTSPLWLGAIAISGWCGVDLHVGAKTLDLLIALATIVTLFTLLDSLTGEKLLALVTAAVFSTHVWFLRWAGSGMETSLATLLSVLTLHALMNRQYNAGAVYATLLTLTRPEASALTAFALLVALWINERKGARLRHLTVFALLSGLLMLPWLVYSYETFGTIIPNTVLAKSSGGFSVVNILSTLADIVKTMGVSDGIALALVLFCSLAAILISCCRSQRPFSSLLTIIRPLAVPIVWIIALPVIYVATSANVVSRYLVITSPAITLLVVAIPTKALGPWFGCKISHQITLSVAAILVLYNVMVFETQVRPQLQVFASSMRECLIYIGTWLTRNTPREASVLVGDVGAIGYYSERRICDAAGLVSPELLPFSRRGYSTERLMREPIYRTRCNADYVVRRSTIREGVHISSLQPLFTRTFYGLSLSTPDTVYYTLFKVIEK